MPLHMVRSVAVVTEADERIAPGECVWLGFDAHASLYSPENNMLVKGQRRRNTTAP